MWAIWSSSTSSAASMPSSKNVIQETGQEKSHWLLGTTSQSWSCWSLLLFFTLLQSKIHVPLLSTPNMDNCRLLSSSSCYGHSASTDVVGTIQERKPLQTLEQEQEWVLSPSWLWRTGGRSPPHPVFLLWLGLHQRETCEIHPGLLHNSAPVLNDLVTSLCKPQNPNFIQFLLDCSCLPEVILAAQEHGDGELAHLFRISRTWVYSLHRTRLKKLGRWNFLWSGFLSEKFRLVLLTDKSPSIVQLKPKTTIAD